MPRTPHGDKDLLKQSIVVGPTLGSASGVWTFVGAARLGLRRLDAAFLAQHSWLGDVAALAKAVAALPHSKSRTFGPRIAPGQAPALYRRY